MRQYQIVVTYDKKVGIVVAMDDTSEAWPAELAKRIGSAIRSTREMQHVSAVKLAARATELGFPIHRVAISKLESGEREVTVPELIVLAAALNTAPLALLLSGTADEAIEVLPDNKMTNAAAIGWFTATTNATPAGVTRDRSATWQLELTMQLNEVDERLEVQRHNLFQAESLTPADAFVESHRGQIEHTREIIKSLEQQRNQIIFWLTDEDGTDGG